MPATLQLIHGTAGRWDAFWQFSKAPGLHDVAVEVLSGIDRVAWPGSARVQAY